jgi:hypothetical protein
LTAGWTLATWNPGNPSGQIGGIYGTNVNVVGRFNGNPTTDEVLVQGRANGSSASFIVVGWSSQVAGQDWNYAKAWIDYVIFNFVSPSGAGWTGSSSVATSVQLGGGLNPAGNIFGGNAGQVSGFVLQLQNQGPEPSSAAIAGLGGVMILICRQRRNCPEKPSRL